jgi:hypothetical protein
MQNELFERLLKEIAEEHGIPAPIIERAWKNQFKVVKDTISSSDREDIESFKTVYIRHIGKFVPRIAEMGYMNNGDDKRDS